MLGLGLGLPQLACQSTWNESRLWPLGAASPGLWIDGPSYPSSCYQDSAGTTALSTVGTVLDSSNPVGLVLDRKGGLALGPEINPSPTWGAGYVLDDALQIPTGWVVYTKANVSAMTVAPGLLSFSATAHLGGIAIGTGKKAVEIYVRARKTAQVSGSPSLEVISHMTADGAPNWEPVVPLGAAIGQWYEKTIKYVALSGTAECYLSSFYGSASWEVSHCSIRELPGIHLSQSTSAARPVASARVNLLTYSEDFSNAAWSKTGTNVSSNSTTAPDGTLTADTLTPTSTGFSAVQAYVVAGTYTASISVKDAGAGSCQVSMGTGAVGYLINVDLTTGAYISGRSYGGGTLVSYEITSQGNGWWKISVTATAINGGVLCAAADGTTPASGVYVWGAQLNLGPTALPYQRVGAASDYTATGFPVYLKLDGTDDGLASATFSAGTLTSSMDLLAVVQREPNSGNSIILTGVSNGVNSYILSIGLIEPSASAACIGCGSPTMLVDNAVVPLLASSLRSALLDGRVHIVEFRGLNLASWTTLVASPADYKLKGKLGSMYLFASGQDANRDKARARMAAYFGVTLP